MLLKMQSQTRLIQEAQGVGDPRMPLLLRVLIVDVRAGADLGECETRLRTTTTLLPAASTIATSKKLFIARRHRRSSLGAPSAVEGADTPRYSAISSLIHYLQNLTTSSLRRSLPSLLVAPLDLYLAWPTLVPHFTLQFSAYSERVLRTSSRLPFS